MTHEDIVNKVNAAISSEFEIPLEKLTPDASLKDDLGLDSLDFVDLVIVLGEAMGTEIRDNERLRSIGTMNDIYVFIEDLKNEAAG